MLPFWYYEQYLKGSTCAEKNLFGLTVLQASDCDWLAHRIGPVARQYIMVEAHEMAQIYREEEQETEAPQFSFHNLSDLKFPSTSGSIS